jgi:hypothetical protein
MISMLPSHFELNEFKCQEMQFYQSDSSERGNGNIMSSGRGSIARSSLSQSSCEQQNEKAIQMMGRRSVEYLMECPSQQQHHHRHHDHKRGSQEDRMMDMDIHSLGASTEQLLSEIGKHKSDRDTDMNMDTDKDMDNGESMTPELDPPQRDVPKLSSQNWASNGSLKAPALTPSARTFSGIGGNEDNMDISAIGAYGGFDDKFASLQSSIASNSKLVEKTDVDILSGRGAGTTSHPGNMRFRRLIEERKPKYKNMKTKDEKKNFTLEVKATIDSYGGRFLKKNIVTGTWVVMAHEEARKKISQCFREK